MTPASTPDSPGDLLQRLIRAGAKLPPALRTAALAAGPAIVPGLIAVLDDDALATAPGQGYAPIHAVTLLADLRAPEAIEPMLRALRASDTLSHLHETLAARLPGFGAAALEPTCRALGDERATDVRHSLLGVLASLGVRDERVWTALRAELREHVGWATSHLRAYGDPRAIPLLEHAAAPLEPGGAESLWREGMDLIEIRGAIEALGGTPSAELRAKLARLDAVRRAVFEPIERSLDVPGSGGRAKVGRNDPCPCGSGKKYKKCCLGTDPGRAA